jgi:hypothetical protein
MVTAEESLQRIGDDEGDTRARTKDAAAKHEGETVAEERREQRGIIESAKWLAEKINTDGRVHRWWLADAEDGGVGGLGVEV